MNDIRASLCLVVGFPCICLYLWVIASLIAVFPTAAKPLSLFLISLSLVRLVLTRGSWWVRQTWPCSHSGVLKLERGYTWFGGRLCWNLQVSCPWDKETQGEADISMVTGFTQQTSWLVFCEANKVGRKADASPLESRCLSLTILLAVISTFWNEDDGLGLGSSSGMASQTCAGLSSSASCCPACWSSAEQCKWLRPVVYHFLPTILWKPAGLSPGIKDLSELKRALKVSSFNLLPRICLPELTTHTADY